MASSNAMPHRSEPEHPARPVPADEGARPPGLPAARRLDLKVGFSCNNRCIFCVQGDKRDRFPDRTSEELVALLAEHRSTTDAVVLTGGEASIRPDIVELVAQARDLGYRTIQLQTNGRRLSYRPFVRGLVSAGLTEVMTALHGSNAPLHDALVRARGAFSQVVAGIRNVRRAGLPVLTNSVIVRDNTRDLPALARLLVSLGVQPVQLALVHPAGTAATWSDQVVPRLSDAAPQIRAALDILRAADRRAYAEAVPYCQMRGYEEHVLEGHVPDTVVVDAQLVVESYETYRQNHGKAQGAVCAECSWRGVCEGPWREYLELYGEADLTPRSDPPPVSSGTP